MRRAVRVPAVDHRVGHDRKQPALEVVTQRRHAARGLRLLGGGQLDRLPERHDPGDVLRPGAQPELLAAAVDDRLDRAAVAHDERADPLGGADLVTGNGEEADRGIAD